MPPQNEDFFIHEKHTSKLKDRIDGLVRRLLGNSFARDWANVLMESKYSDKIEISYVYAPHSHKGLKDRVGEAHIIFYSIPKLQQIHKLKIPETKLWAVGTKSFGTNSGIFYNYTGDDYYQQRTSIKSEFIAENDKLKKEWGDRYIDYIGKVIDKNHTVPVFTPLQKFISQDTTHFTKAGAQYFAYLFEQDLDNIFAKVNK